MSRFTNDYPEDWPAIAKRTKDEAGWRCVRCSHPHEPKAGYTLTCHHLDGDKSNCAWWNIPALCQRCHLSIQARVHLERPWLFAHTPWFKPFAGGYFAKKYLDLDLTREEVMANLDYYAGLEVAMLQEAA